ncbi:MAG: aminotransferase DegT, partial [Acidobacteria bacterium]
GRLEGRARLLDISLDGGTVPLFFPLPVPDKHAAAQALWEQGICAVEFWNHGVPDGPPQEGRDCRYLREHLLELPIHQDVTPRHVEYVADTVLRLGVHF